jgi:hypothetical protein
MCAIECLVTSARINSLSDKIQRQLKSPGKSSRLDSASTENLQVP